MTASTSSLFEDIVAAWDEPLCCQSQQSPAPCRNQARWIAVRQPLLRLPGPGSAGHGAAVHVP